MLTPKPIPASAIPAALEKALRYRLLNEPLEAESICRDVLAADAGSQEALVTLLLALTDQFEKRFTDSLELAKQALPRLTSEFDQAYYEGIVYERWAKAQIARGLPGESAAHWLREALRCFDRAMRLSPADDPDATLRWNTCVRLLHRYESADAESGSFTHDVAAGFGDDTVAR
jgi:tetratricopeptide (TPR) repeat protein